MNPLKQFKQDNPDLTWNMISEKTSIPLQTLYDLCRLEDFGDVPLKTVKRLKQGIGVSLLSYYLKDKSNEEVELKKIINIDDTNDTKVLKVPPKEEYL